MKTNDDVVRGWVAKARSDLRAMKSTLRAGVPEAAGFHAQQAAEKMIKAYMVFRDRDFPFTHDIEKLLEVAADIEPKFRRFRPSAKILTPYAVDARYSIYFSPTLAKARIAVRKAEAIVRFVLARLGPLGVERRRRKARGRKP